MKKVYQPPYKSLRKISLFIEVAHIKDPIGHLL